MHIQPQEQREDARVTAVEPDGDPLLRHVPERWADVGVGGEPWPFLAMCALTRLQRLVKKVLEDELRRHSLSHTGYFLLTTLALHSSGGRTRLSNLARFLMVHTTSVTLSVDQLRRQGLVERHPHPSDRRATIIQITKAGRRVVDEVNASLNAADGPFAELDGRGLFEGLQPARLALGDTEL